MSDLDDILNGVEPEPTDIEPQESAEPVVEAEASTGEEVTEPEKEEVAEESTPEPKKSESQTIPYEAYKDERTKRQDRDREIERLRLELEGLKNPKEPVKIPDVFEDQEGFNSYINQQIQQANLQSRVEMSNFMAEKDYGAEVVAEKLDTFKQMVSKNPQLSAEIQSSPSPIHAAIDIVDKASQAEQLKNVDKVMADVKEKARAELEAEIRAEYEAKYQKRESVTPSLNSMASVNGSTEPSDDLASILGR